MVNWIGISGIYVFNIVWGIKEIIFFVGYFLGIYIFFFLNRLIMFFIFN